MGAIEILVPLEELSAQMNGSPAAASYWVERAGGKVERDWANRPCTSSKDAARALDAYREEMRRHAQLQTDYDLYLRRRQEELRAVRERAFEKAGLVALEQERRGMVENENIIFTSVPVTMSGRAFRVAQSAADAAQREFEAKHPVLSLDEFAKRRNKR